MRKNSKVANYILFEPGKSSLDVGSLLLPFVLEKKLMGLILEY